jgi:hypothetical protein
MFRDCFSRQEPRDNFFQYMVGQLSQVERKSIEPIALSVKDAKVRAMQFFVSDVAWEDEDLVSIYRSMIGEDMGDPNGALIFDESGFVKKGNDSAGVARQSCGNIGKVESCQVGGPRSIFSRARKRPFPRHAAGAFSPLLSALSLRLAHGGCGSGRFLDWSGATSISMAASSRCRGRACAAEWGRRRTGDRGGSMRHNSSARYSKRSVQNGVGRRCGRREQSQEIGCSSRNEAPRWT